MKRRTFLATAAATTVDAQAAAAAPARRYQVGAYYFPNYHVDPRNERAHGKNWTEWDLVKAARPRFDGHQQPRVPAWGYQDEAQPPVMAQKINAAADHGINHFLFDWYWYNDGPFLERCLNDGFLKAPNNDRLQFALMWANHDWVDIHPAKLGAAPRLQFPGAIDNAAFDRMTSHLIQDYFVLPNYWRVDGKPYFSIYELHRLLQGLGGVDAAQRALDRFRSKALAAGLPGVHLNAVVWGVQILPGESTATTPRQLLDQLGIDSVTSYVWVHHTKLNYFPQTPYREVAAAAAKHWPTVSPQYGKPYHPNVTVGWDASPRTVQTDRFENRGYPFMPTLAGNTPEAFERALRQVRAFMDKDPAQPRICNINAWNEWTEGSYLEPDTQYRDGYLKAIKKVFGA